MNIPQLNWHDESHKNVAEALITSQKEGLTQREAERRLLHYGPNRLQEKPKASLLSRFFDQFNDCRIQEGQRNI